MIWTALLDIADKLPSLSTITENVKQATNNALATYDIVALRFLRTKLSQLRQDTIDVNSMKIDDLQDMKDYLDKAPFHKKWSDLQTVWIKIPDRLAALSLEMNAGTSADIMSSQAAATLKATLSRQQNFYTNLSTMPEPTDNQQLQQFAQIYGVMKSLVDQIQALETAIDDYLAKRAS
jgi:hypothetical protein